MIAQKRDAAQGERPRTRQKAQETALHSYPPRKQKVKPRAQGRKAKEMTLKESANRKRVKKQKKGPTSRWMAGWKRERWNKTAAKGARVEI
jgi:hypothetical protein